MKVFISVLPPGGGEAVQSVEVELDAVPQTGDYISVAGPEGGGTEDFIVRRSWWNLYRTTEDRTTAELQQALVIAEMAYGPFSSESHKTALQGFEAEGKKVEAFESSAYQ